MEDIYDSDNYYELFQSFDGEDHNIVVEFTGYANSSDNNHLFPDIMFVAYNGNEYQLEWDDFSMNYEGSIEGNYGSVG